jgi:hypothetical protein
MVFEDVYGFSDEADRFQSGDRIGLDEKVGEPLKICQRPRGVDYARQGLAFGL